MKTAKITKQLKVTKYVMAYDIIKKVNDLFKGNVILSGRKYGGKIVVYPFNSFTDEKVHAQKYFLSEIRKVFLKKI